MNKNLTKKIVRMLEIEQDKTYLKVAEKNQTNLSFCEGFIQGQINSLNKLNNIFDETTSEITKEEEKYLDKITTRILKWTKIKYTEEQKWDLIMAELINIK